MAPPGGGTGGGSGGGGGINPDIIRSLTELLGSSNTNLERMLENLGRLGASSQSLTGLAGAAQELSDHLGGLGRSLTDLQRLLGRVNDQSKKQSSILKMMGSAWKTFGAAVKGAMNILSGLTDVISTVGGALWDLGAAIIAAPFEMLNWLIKKSKQVIGSGTEIATAYEKIREQFGDLTKGTSKDVIDFGKSMATGMITPTLSARRVFGSLAESLNKALEVAQAAPATFQLLSDQFEKNGLEIMAMANGLGLGNEELTALQQRAIATGTSLVDLESEITKYAKGMSAQFGLNSKAMSRDMGRALKDVKHFANSTVKEIAQATTYAHKLGLELKDITGVLDKFNTFDEAAENVSKLSQAFGINVDAMKLVEAKSPADALDMIKQAMAAAGKSADQMNRQELQLLASTVGMSEEQVRMAFSMKNAGVSMDKVKQSGTGLEHQMMSTSEAVASLANDMKRLTPPGQQPAGDSFFEIFVEGFLEGIDTSKTFLSLLQAVMKDMYIVRDAGRQLGRAFIENFPGVKDFINGLKEMLNPTAIKGLMSNVVNIFKDFFDQLNKGTADTGKLFDSLVNGFTNFAEKTSGGSQMLKGLKNIWKAVEQIISTGIDWLSNKLRSGLDFIVKLLSGDFNDVIANFADKAPGAIKDAVTGGAAAAVDSPIAKSFISLFKNISGPLEKIFELLWEKVTNKLVKFLKEHKWEIALATMGGSVFNLVSSALVSAASNPAALAAFGKLGAAAAAAGAVVAVYDQASKLREELKRDEEINRQAEIDHANEMIRLEQRKFEEKKKSGELTAKQIEEERKVSSEKQKELALKSLETTAAAVGTGKNTSSWSLSRFQDSEEFAKAFEQRQQSINDLLASNPELLKQIAEDEEKLFKNNQNAYLIKGEEVFDKLKEIRIQGAREMGQDYIKELLKEGKLGSFKTPTGQEIKFGDDDFTSNFAQSLMVGYSAKDLKERAGGARSFAEQSAARRKRGGDLASTFGRGSSLAEFAGSIFGTEDPAKEAAEKEAARGAEIQDAKQKALDALKLDSDFSVNNAEESIKKVEDLAKRMTGKSLEDLKKSLDDIRAAFKGMDFTILPPGESDKLMGSVLDMSNVNKLMVSIADAADNMANIPKAASKLAQLPNDAKTYSDSVARVRSFLFGEINKGGVSKGVIWSMSEIGADASIYITKLDTTTGTLGSISSSVEGIAGHIEKIMNALPKLQRGGGLSNAFSIINTIAKSSDNLKGNYTSESAVKEKVDAAMAAAKTAMTQAAPGMKSLVDASSELSKTLTDNIVRSIDGTANRIDQLFASLEKITAAIAKPIGAQSPQELGAKVKSMVDAINQLNAAMTDIKIGDNGEVNVKMNNLAKGINKADQKYTIEKKNAVINLTVSVSMSVTDVESMLIKNPNSLIRARINDALSTDKKEINAGGTGTVDVGT
jgi:hypothetical protein